MGSQAPETDIMTLAKSAVAALMRQDLSAAESLANQVLAINPINADGLHTLASCRFLQQQFPEALALVEKAMAHNPPHHKLFYLRAGVLLSLGKIEEALGDYRQTVALSPTMAMAHFQMGVIHHQNNRLEEAVTCYKLALEHKPDMPYPLNNLAIAYRDLGREEDAIDLLTDLIRRNPKHYNALNNLGLAYFNQGKYPEASQAYEEALRLKPDFVEAHYNLGLLRYKQSRFKDAITAYEESLRLDPHSEKTLHNIGLAYYDLNEHEKAIGYYKQALALKPDYTDALNNLGLAYGQQGNMTEAHRYFSMAIEVKPERHLWRFRAGNLCPVIMESEPEILALREQLAAHVEDFMKQDFTIQLSDMPTIDCRPPFYLPYHGLDDLPLKTRYATFIEQLFRRSGYGELMDKPGPTQNDIPHIGFIVTQGHELAFIKVIGGILKHFQPYDFKVSVVCSRLGAAIFKQVIGEGHYEYVVMPDKLEAIVRFIKTLKLDVAYLLEVGTDPSNYYLSFFNLAPVQVTSWGFPETSAVPGVDYYLSSKHWEPEGAQSHYRETLIECEHLPVYYPQPALEYSAPLKTREELRLPKDVPIYACIQQLFKFHPSFDLMLGKLLAADPDAKLLLIQNKHDFQNRTLVNRLSKVIPNLGDRIILRNKYHHQAYLHLLAQPDIVFLDTTHYDGGVTSYDAMAMGAITITLPGTYMRSRKTYGCYQQMGVSDCVAHSPEHYIELAGAFMHDPALREAVQTRIREASSVLYEDMHVVAELQQFFRHAVERSANPPAVC